MLNKQGFDLWANDYDQTVQISEDNNRYPFAGYKQILNIIFNKAMQKPNSTILDIGFGTAVLTSKLYEHGHTIDGIDFSPNMISIARKKMPTANLIEWDISKGLPKELQGKKYDSIISTYTLHHLTDEDKVMFIQQLLPLLNEDGQLLIGDIAFKTENQLEVCREENKAHWDDDEFYFVEEKIKPCLEKVAHFEFTQVSHCGGVFVIKKI